MLFCDQQQAGYVVNHNRVHPAPDFLHQNHQHFYSLHMNQHRDKCFIVGTWTGVNMGAVNGNFSSSSRPDCWRPSPVPLAEAEFPFSPERLKALPTPLRHA